MIGHRSGEGASRRMPWVIALVGPDGAGKSSLIRELVRLLPDDLHVEVRHWRPGALPPLASLLGQAPEPGEASVPPRRSGGRFHVARLLYYGVDFLLGDWWLRRRDPQGAGPDIVVYDRCALDMNVDPVRYGLSSSAGTIALWRMIPKPDRVMLLLDDAEGIRARKAELTEAEIRSQMTRWLELARSGRVQGGLEVDAPPSVLAGRLVPLVTEALGRGAGAADPDASPAGDTPHMLAALGIRRHLSGERDGGSDDGQLFAAVPSVDRARLLLPVKDRRSSLASLRLYQPQRWSARLASKGLALAIRTGLAPLLLRSRLVLESPSSSVGNSVALLERFRRAFGVRDVKLGFSLGTPGPHRKPLVQVTTPDGVVLGYGKVGWNPRTQELLHREREALEWVAGQDLGSVEVPRIKADDAWDGGRLLALGAPESPWRNGASRMGEAHHRFLVDLHRADSGWVGMDAWSAPLRERAKQLDDLGLAYDAYLIRWALERCTGLVGPRGVPVGPRHGDFTPWNTLTVRRGLFVIDWEYFERCSPAGWDFFHFVMQTSILVEGLGGSEVLVRLADGPVRRLGERLFQDLDVPLDLYETLMALYVADIASYYRIREAEDGPSASSLLYEAWRSVLFLFASGAMNADGPGEERP